MPADRIETTIRLPRELHDQLSAEAERKGISLNALLTMILLERQAAQ